MGRVTAVRRWQQSRWFQEQFSGIEGSALVLIVVLHSGCEVDLTASKYKPQERSLAISEMAMQETQPLPVLLIGHGSRDSDAELVLGA